MAEELRLDMEKTYELIRKAALDRRFVSYGDIAGANNVSWKWARRRVPRQRVRRRLTRGHRR